MNKVIFHGRKNKRRERGEKRRRAPPQPGLEKEFEAETTPSITIPAQGVIRKEPPV